MTTPISDLVGRLRLYKFTCSLQVELDADLTIAADSLEELQRENERLRMEFRADCERQAEELYVMQRVLTDIANADTVEWDDPTEFEAWAKGRARAVLDKQKEPK